MSAEVVDGGAIVHVGFTRALQSEPRREPCRPGAA